MEQIFPALAGALLGILSGLIPGVHANTIATVLTQSGLDSSILPALILGALGSHIIVSYFPAVFLSIPEEGTYVSVLPAHRMTLRGKGLEALRICVISILLSSSLSFFLLPVSVLLFPFLSSLIQPAMPVALILAAAFLIFSEKEKIPHALLVFLLSGVLGYLALNSTINEPLFPLFTGLFAISALIMGTKNRDVPEKQEDRLLKLNFKKFILLGILLGFIADLFPGIGSPAQVAVFASAFVAMKSREFLALTSSIASSHVVFAIASMVILGRARVGALAAAGSIAEFTAQDIPFMAGILMLSLGMGAIFLIAVSRLAGPILRANFLAINSVIAAFLLFTVALLSGPLGLLVLATATAIGLSPMLFGVKRIHVMGAILLPTIILYLS